MYFLTILLFAIPLPASAEGSRTLDLSSFSKIEASGNVVLDLTVGGEQAVTIGGSEKTLEKAKVKVKGETLVIDRRTGIFFWRDASGEEPLMIKATIPALSEIEISGTARGTVAGVTGKKFELEISGTADLTLSGKVEEFVLESSGNSNINAGSLEADRVTTEMSGTGNVDVNPIKELKADVSGVGNVTYKSRPAVVRSNVSGIGTVEQKG